MSPYVTTDLSPEGIATVTFFHPAQNSLPGHLLQLLADTIEQTGQNPNAKIIILKSGGDRTFCAGASFDELASIQTEAEGLTFFSGFAKVINACRCSPVLIIGRVQGKAVGGGVGLAAATDYCFATQHAAVRLSELNGLGLKPANLEKIMAVVEGREAKALRENVRKLGIDRLLKTELGFAEVKERVVIDKEVLDFYIPET